MQNNMILPENKLVCSVLLELLGDGGQRILLLAYSLLNNL